MAYKLLNSYTNSRACDFQQLVLDWFKFCLIFFLLWNFFSLSLKSIFFFFFTIQKVFLYYFCSDILSISM